MWLLGLGIRLGRLSKGVGSKVGGFVFIYVEFREHLRINSAGTTTSKKKKKRSNPYKYQTADNLNVQKYGTNILKLQST